MIPYGKHWIDDDDIKAVVDVLKGDWLTQGPKVSEFEKALADYCGAAYAVAVSNGTAALHLACLAAGITEGDEVITSPMTFVASANCILYCGGTPVFADIDSASWNIDTADINRKIGAKTKAIIPVHFAGLPCDMEAIGKLAQDHNLIVIEDACHALGAEWKDAAGQWQKTGSCSHSDMTVFSFHPVKHITTGEGGAILTNNAAYYEKLLLLRSHGITKNPEKFVHKDPAVSSTSPEPWYYEMQELGFNYRITDMQCALGLTQLRRNKTFVERRRSIAQQYDDAFKNSEHITVQPEPAAKRNAHHLYAVQIDFARTGRDRASFMHELHKKGIGTQVHYIPVHLQPYYRKRFGSKEGDHPVSEAYYRKALSLPLFPKMSDANVASVIKAVKDTLHGK